MSRHRVENPKTRRLTDAEDDRLHHLYFLYSADGDVLYIGVATDVQHRVYMHMQTNVCPDAYWIQRAYTEHSSQPIGTRAEAREAERRAIAEYAPCFNRQHNPTRWKRRGNEWVPVDREEHEELLWRLNDWAEMAAEMSA